MFQSRDRGFVFAIALLMAIGPVAGSALASHGDDAAAWTQEQKLTPVSPTAGFQPQVGDAVALSGDTALVGVPGLNRTHVYVQDAGGWSEQDTLTPPDEDSSSFGTAVALDDAGDTALIGDSSEPAAYLFERGTDGEWTQTATLTPPSNPPPSAFGSAVALDGDTAIVGDPGAGTESNQGVAWVFDQASGSWGPVFHVLGDSPDELGWSVALDGDTALVGERFGDDVHVLDGTNGWSIETTLTDRGSGKAVALQGDTALVGDSGEVDVYETSTWTQTATLTDDRLFGSTGFGSAVALQGDTVLVGAPSGRTIEGGAEAGAGYVFQHDDGHWAIVDRLTSNDGVPGDDVLEQFGSSVALGDDEAFLGAPFDTGVAGAQVGAAFVFAADCVDDGPASGAVHDHAEPLVGDQVGAQAEDDVHEQNCRWLTARAGI